MSRFWGPNLTALSLRVETDSRRLASLLDAAGPAPDLGLKNREGVVVPGLWADGRARALNSVYDQAREAERWAAEVAGGTVAVFGAAGTALAEALERRGTALLFWVEPRLEVWRSLLTWEDWTPWLKRRDWFPVSGGPEEWGQSLMRRYHPLWDGAFSLREWRPAVQSWESLWNGHRNETAAALESLASDNSTQARFGERWYRNALANLRDLAAGSFPPCPGARVVVAGAGPGLEDALQEPANLRWLAGRKQTGDKLFSTDTAFPALTARGIEPDLVLCLDGQLPTYHHFVPPRPAVPLVADLCALPLLSRLEMPVVRYLSGHPFGAVIRRHYPELPTLDGSLGNVSGLALTAARALGAAAVDSWGVDFCYRDGKSYAAGTYVYELAGRRADRTSPWESRLGASCYGARGRERSVQGGRRLDTTPLLRDYKKRWDNAPAVVPPVELAHGDSASRWPEFSASWRSRLQSLPLPPPSAGVQTFVESLPHDQRTDWLALWPLALALHRQGTPAQRLPQATVERAYSFLED